MFIIEFNQDKEIYQVKEVEKTNSSFVFDTYYRAHVCAKALQTLYDGMELQPKCRLMTFIAERETRQWN